MAIYIYKCNTCGNREEKLQKITEKGSYPCKCSPVGVMHPQITTTHAIFKGTGFFKTDYK
jgi:putative FmdB family regulatory protein